MLLLMAEFFPVADMKPAWVPDERTRRGVTLVEHPATKVAGLRSWAGEHNVVERGNVM